MRKVLFVDDEQHVLDGLKRMLHPMRSEWKMSFAATGPEALKLLSESPYDVLVTDVRMPEMNGVELLTEVTRLHPQVVRIVLSGTADHQMTMRSVTLAHQYLMKPCDADVLRDTVEKAFALHNILDDPALTKLIGRMRTLPSVPAIYSRLMQALGPDDASADVIGGIISQDLGMTAKILQLINSPLFGYGRSITNPQDAVVYLGVDTVRALALTESAFSKLDAQNDPGFAVDELRNHCFEVAAMARAMAMSRRLPRLLVDDIFLGALLHDIGKLVLGCNFPAQYRLAAQYFDDAKALRETELRIFGANHAQIGGYLLWLWGLPERVTEIVARHHSEEGDPADSQEPAAVVQGADAMVREGLRAVVNSPTGKRV